jgi:hypothetical protein
VLKVKVERFSVAEGQARLDAILVGLVNESALAEEAAALGTFAGEQMATPGARAKNFAGAGDFEPFRHGLSGFDAFGTTHNLNSFSKKEGAL